MENNKYGYVIEGKATYGGRLPLRVVDDSKIAVTLLSRPRYTNNNITDRAIESAEERERLKARKKDLAQKTAPIILALRRLEAEL